MVLIIIETPSKRRAWENFMRRTATPGDVVSTMGGVCAFQDANSPVGISFDERRVDHGRRLDPEKARLISEAVAAVDTDRILIATDPDDEGDVVALDIIDVIAAKNPDKVRSCWRVRATSLSVNAISNAVNEASQIVGDIDGVMEAAISGRARAVTDRWISASLSSMAGIPVDRTRSAMMGSIAGMRDGSVPVETGEVVLMGRPSGGTTWFARYSAVSGADDATIDRIANLANRFRGRMVPGVIRPVMSLSAAVAPRFGNLRPFSTGDLIAHAGRHHAIPCSLAMSALQAAYAAGMVSFPRTVSRDLSRESAALVARLGASCGIKGLDPEICCEIGAGRGEQALHPTFGSAASEISTLREILFRDWGTIFPPSGGGPVENFRDVVCLIVALVSRRAIEASRDILLERGKWSPTNAGGTGLTSDDIDLLESLEWERETGQVMPWGRDMSAGVRVWPADTVMVDAMMTLGHDGADNIARQASVLMDSGWVIQAPDFEPPMLSSAGVAAAMRTPDPFISPAVFAATEDAIRSHAFEDSSERFDSRIRKRVLRWTEALPSDLRRAMMASLDRADGARRMPTFGAQRSA